MPLVRFFSRSEWVAQWGKRAFTMGQCGCHKPNPAHGRWWLGSASRSQHNMDRSSLGFPSFRSRRVDIAELRQSVSRFESEVAQERVDREQERSQDAHLIKELRKALRNVRDIVRASLAAMRGDPPSVTGQHTASKKRPRDEDEDDRVSLQELVDSLMA